MNPVLEQRMFVSLLSTELQDWPLTHRQLPRINNIAPISWGIHFSANYLSSSSYLSKQWKNNSSGATLQQHGCYWFIQICSPTSYESLLPQWLLSEKRVGKFPVIWTITENTFFLPVLWRSWQDILPPGLSNASPLPALSHHPNWRPSTEAPSQDALHVPTTSTRKDLSGRAKETNWGIPLLPSPAPRGFSNSSCSLCSQFMSTICTLTVVCTLPRPCSPPLLAVQRPPRGPLLPGIL